GAGFDLAVAVAVAAAAGVVDPARVAARVHLGELGLDGRLRPLRGVLPAVAAAVAAGRSRVVVPADNEAEARLVPGADVLGATHLAHVLQAHGADCADPLAPVAARGAEPRPSPTQYPPDLVDVVGQPQARKAVEVAAAGAHHLLM